MARQEGFGLGRLKPKGDKWGSMTLVGIDPGDRFTGVASIEIRGSWSIWRSGVFQSDEDYLAPVFMLEEALRSLIGPFIALEDFRIRAVGHQTFARPYTPRLIGAIEYMARQVKCPVMFIPPGSIDRDLEAFGIRDRIRWMTQGGTGDHAQSAWRLIGHMILQEFQFLEYLLDERQTRMENWQDQKSDRWHKTIEKYGGSWTKPMIMKRINANH